MFSAKLGVEVLKEWFKSSHNDINLFGEAHGTSPLLSCDLIFESGLEIFFSKALDGLKFSLTFATWNVFIN